jgi:hypothetical protein
MLRFNQVIYCNIYIFFYSSWSRKKIISLEVKG